MAKDNDQQRLDGSTVGDQEDDEDEQRVDDFGEECPYWRTLGGHRRDTINSLMQKSVRRSDSELAQFAAFEMTRSGFGQNCVNRLMLYLVEDIAAGEQAVLTVPPLVQVAQQAGVGSHVGQIAAMKAAQICADSWSSREAVHYDDYLRHVAKLRVECDDPRYEFPIEPEDPDNERDARPPAGGQMTFVDDGDLEPHIPTNDYGEELRKGETHGGFNDERLLTMLDDAIANEGIELAGFVAWELTRSGYHEEFWDRLAELGVLYSSVGSLVSPLIAQYEELATGRWKPDDWEGRLCAIHATISVIRKGVTTDVTDRCEDLHELAERRANGDATFPVEPEELDVGKRYCVAVCKHTRPGAWAGRDWKHFWLRSCRVARPGEPSHSCQWQRERFSMEMEYFRNKFTYATEDQIEHALSPVSEDDPWEEDRIAPDKELDAFE